MDHQREFLLTAELCVLKCSRVDINLSNRERFEANRAADDKALKTTASLKRPTKACGIKRSSSSADGDQQEDASDNWRFHHNLCVIKTGFILMEFM